MQQLRALMILSAANDLSSDRHSTMQNIARAVTCAIPRGPVAVTAVAAHAPFDPGSVCFERADPDYMSRFHQLRPLVTAVVHELVGALAPGVVVDLDRVLRRSPRAGGLARKLLRVCIA